MSARLAPLLAAMTLEEKADLVTGHERARVLRAGGDQRVALRVDGTDPEAAEEEVLDGRGIG